MVWPSAVARYELKEPNHYYVSAAVALGIPPSTYTGRVVETDFTCPSAESQSAVTLVHGSSPATLLAGTASSEVIDLNDGGSPETLTIECAFVWDTNGDGAVSVSDIALVVLAFGLTVPPAPTERDVDFDGAVSVGDIVQVVQHFGQMAP